MMRIPTSWTEYERDRVASLRPTRENNEGTDAHLYGHSKARARQPRRTFMSRLKLTELKSGSYRTNNLIARADLQMHNFLCEKPFMVEESRLTQAARQMARGWPQSGRCIMFLMTNATAGEAEGKFDDATKGLHQSG
jgi:hypothetical protein